MASVCIAVSEVVSIEELAAVMDPLVETINFAANSLRSSLLKSETVKWHEEIKEDWGTGCLSPTGNTRSQAIVDAPVWKLRALLRDVHSVKLWDPSFQSHEFIRSIDPQTQVNRRTFVFSGTYALDFVYFVRDVDLEDGSVILLGQSVEVPGVPATAPGFSRGNLQNYSFILRKVEENKTLLTVIYRVDLPGVTLPEDVAKAFQDEDLRVAFRIKETLHTWDPYNAATQLKTDVLHLEEHQEGWEELAHVEGVLGSRSGDHSTVRSQGEVQASVADVLAYLQDPAQFKVWSPILKSHNIVFAVDAHTKVHKRVYELPEIAFEYIYFTRALHLEDGSAVLVSKSIDLPNHHSTPGRIPAEYLNYSFVLRKVSPGVTKLTLVSQIDPKVNLPDVALKPIQTGDSLTVTLIRKGLANWHLTDLITPVAGSAHAQVVDAIQHFREWEKLADEDQVQGYRAPNLKTVVSSGVLSVGLAAAKAFLTDELKFPLYTEHLKEQKVLAFVDDQTKIHFRVSKVEGLPNIESVYVTREFQHADGSLALVSRSLDYPGAPALEEGSVRLELVNQSYLLRKVNDSTTELFFVIDVNNPFQLSPEVLRALQTNDSLRVRVIKKHLHA